MASIRYNLRRAIWNLLRVEWENLRQKAKKAKLHDSYNDDDSEVGIFASQKSERVPLAPLSTGGKNGKVATA